MADKEVWNLGGPVVPAAGDRIGVGTGPLAGGYSERQHFIWKDPNGKFIHNGASPNYSVNFADTNPSRGVIADIANNAAAGLNGALLSFTQNTINSWCIGQAPGADAFAIYVGRNGAADGAEVLRINSGGNVGIGTTAPGAKLQVAGTGGTSVISLLETGVRNWAIRAGGAASNVFDIADLTAGATRLSITLGGDVGIGTGWPSVRLHVKAVYEGARFETTVARGGGSPFLTFYDPTGRKGFFGYGGVADAFVVSNEMNEPVVIATNGINRWMFEAGGNFRPYNDNGFSVGVAANRISVLYAGTGTINTSDEREKKWRGALSDAEFAAGIRVLDELGFYQWLDAVDEKGARSARFHFGARAQRVWAIFADAKLIDPIKNGKPGATPYAFLCWDAWDEERRPIMKEKKVRKTRPVMVDSGKVDGDGEPVLVEKEEAYFETEMVDSGKTEVVRAAGDRFGLRLDQFALFLVACIDERARRDAAAASDRLAALEAALADLAKG